jgi:hypothetical protein
MWGPAALKLTDRDADIGWTDRQRAERIGLIVQNRRFLVLCRALQPALQNRPPRFRRRAQRLACRRPRHAAARVGHRRGETSSPFTCESDELHHGRKERRVYKVYQIEPLRVGLPHIRTNSGLFRFSYVAVIGHRFAPCYATNATERMMHELMRAGNLVVQRAHLEGSDSALESVATQTFGHLQQCDRWLLPATGWRLVEVGIYLISRQWWV